MLFQLRTLLTKIFFSKRTLNLKKFKIKPSKFFLLKLTFKHIDASALSPSTKGGDESSFVLGTSLGGGLLLTSAVTAGCDRVLFRLAASVLDLSVRLRVRGFSTGGSETSAFVLFSVKRQLVSKQSVTNNNVREITLFLLKVKLQN